MKFQKVMVVLVLVALSSSCVSTKVYKDLESKYAELKREHRKTDDDLASYKKSSEESNASLKNLKGAHEKLTTERDQLQTKYDLAKSKYENLQKSYEALSKNSSAAITENTQKNRQLLAELEVKEKALLEEKSRLKNLEKTLKSRSERVDELESLMAAKDAKMNSLKETISKALTDFEGKGLTIERRDGKVYVSMENKLLFSSGSWAVNSQGRVAVEKLGNVLGQNPDISVLIEGHTDNVPYSGNAVLENNWDLSTKRATAIVGILIQNQAIQPHTITAAGRGKFSPVATNDTPEGRAKNRRIEVVLTPKLDAVSNLLKTI